MNTSYLNNRTNLQKEGECLKKYYHLFLRGVIGETLFWLVLFLVGLVAGSLYSISLKNQTELFFVLNQITMTPLSHEGNEWALLKESIGIHLIQLIGMWLGGLSKLTFSISLLIFLGISFSYGFSVTSFFLLYGMKGIWVNLLLFGLQGLIIVFMGMYIGEHSLRYQQKGKEHYLKPYLNVLGFTCISIGIVSLVDTYIQPMLQTLIYRIL